MNHLQRWVEGTTYSGINHMDEKERIAEIKSS